MLCKNCETEMPDNSKFCPQCGSSQMPSPPPNPTVSYPASGSTISNKIKISCIVSAINAIVSFIIRIKTQKAYYSWSNLLENRKLVGIDKDVKPFLTSIPVVALIVVLILIISDKEMSSRQKGIALIICAVFILISLLCIWLDIPYSIIDM